MASTNRADQTCPVCGQPLSFMEYEHIASKTPGIMNLPMVSTRTLGHAKELVRAKGPGLLPVLVGGVGRYLWGFFRGLLAPYRLLPGYLLGGVWLVLSYFIIRGMDFPLQKVLVWLTFSSAGLDGGVWGAIGGIVGKGIFAGALFRLITKEGMWVHPSKNRTKEYSLPSFAAGLGLSWVLFNFFTWDNDPNASVIGLVAALGAVRAMGNKKGYYSSVVRSFWRERDLDQGRSMSLGMALGFVLAVPCSLIAGPWSGYFVGVPLFLAGLIFGKSRLAKRLRGRSHMILLLVLAASKIDSVQAMELAPLEQTTLIRWIVIGVLASFAAATAASTVFSSQKGTQEDEDIAREPKGEFRLGVEKTFGDTISKGKTSQQLQVWLEKRMEDGSWQVYPCEEGQLSMYLTTTVPGLRLDSMTWDKERKRVGCTVLLERKWPGAHGVVAFKCHVPQVVTFHRRMLFHLEENENKGLA